MLNHVFWNEFQSQQVQVKFQTQDEFTAFMGNAAAYDLDFDQDGWFTPLDKDDIDAITSVAVYVYDRQKYGFSSPILRWTALDSSLLLKIPTLTYSEVIERYGVEEEPLEPMAVLTSELF